jgi:hypothetical protein
MYGYLPFGVSMRPLYYRSKPNLKKPNEIYFTAVRCCLPTQLDSLGPPRRRFCAALVICYIYLSILYLSRVFRN